MKAKTLLNILKALAAAALFTWIGVTLLGCAPPKTVEECAASPGLQRVYGIFDCTKTPGCETEPWQLEDLRYFKEALPQCFTEHFP